MPLTIRDGNPATRYFRLWMIAIWILLLLAAMGGVQYLLHADYAYLAAAMLIIVVCAGCLLRQAWARPAMQVLALLLALWSLTTGILMLHQWGDFEIARQQALVQPQALAQLTVWVINRAQRTWQVALVLKAVAVPGLLWLAWQLGRPAVRLQFRRRHELSPTVR